VYPPKQNRKRVGSKAFRHLLETFFSESIEEALAAHLGERETDLTDGQMRRLIRLIDYLVLHFTLII